MATNTDLSGKMLRRADADGLPPEHLLRVLAAGFDAATTAYFDHPQACDVKTFMRAWVRARRTWCEYSGESLV